MPNSKFYWKGCPYHRLPRIQIPSSHTALIRARYISGLSDHQPFQRPTTSALEPARKKKRFKIRFRRRKERSSRSSSSEARARRRASQRARQDIQVFGWTTPGAELASKLTTETARPASSIRIPYGAQPELVAALQSTRSIAAHSTDGAATSVYKLKQSPSKKSSNLYSLTRVAEVPVYWTAKGKVNRNPTLNPNRLGIHSSRQTFPENGHTGSFQIVSNIRTDRTSNAIEKSRTHDPRTTVNNRVSKDRRTKSNTRSKESITIRRTITNSIISPKNRYKKYPGFGDPAYWKAINSFALQSKLDDSLSSSIRSIAQSVFSDTASRTESQNKAISRFTKELDFYLQEAKSRLKQPQVSSVSSVSSSSISAHTVAALKPYHLEFEKAGLAVTAAEQKGLPKLEPLLPPPTPPKDEKWMRKSSPTLSNMAPGREKKLSKAPPKDKQPSFASGSTGTDVIGFTPPHEKTYARGPAHKRHSSSEGSVLGWTPPHERNTALPSKPAPSVPLRPSTKRSLPWLRKQESSPESSSPPKKKTTVPEPALTGKPSDPLNFWVDSYDIKDVPSPPKFKERNELVMTPRGGIPHRSMELRPKEPRDHTEKNKIFSSPHKLTEITTPKGSLAVETTKTASEQLSQTSNKELRPSEVAWKGVENFTQTDFRAPAETKIGQPFQRKILPFTPVDKSVVDRSYTIPFSMGTGRGAGPFQPSAVLRRPVDKIKLPMNNEVQSASVESNVLGSSARRLLSPPLVCIQCGCCTGPKIPDPEPNPPTSTFADVEEESLDSRCPTRPIIPAGDIVYQNGPVPKENAKQMRFVEETIDEYAKKEPLADPMKKLSITSLMKTYPTNPSTRLQKQPMVSNTLPVAVPPSETTIDSSNLHSDQISNKKVFKGLHVATAAGCDEDVDKWINEITGCSVRKFLSDLSAFDGLGVNTLADVARRAAKQRRERVRAWEAIRERALEEAEREGIPGDGTSDAIEGKDGKLHIVASDESINLREARKHLIKETQKRKALTADEGIKERAVRMGWRERSMSAGLDPSVGC